MRGWYCAPFLRGLKAEVFFVKASLVPLDELKRIKRVRVSSSIPTPLMIIAEEADNTYLITSLPLFLLSTTAPPTPSPSTLIVAHTCKDCSQCHNLLVRIFEHIIPLWLDQWKLGSKILENPWKCQRWKSCLSLLQSVEVGPSGRQQRRNERAVTKYICIILPFMVSLTFNFNVPSYMPALFHQNAS